MGQTVIKLNGQICDEQTRKDIIQIGKVLADSIPGIYPFSGGKIEIEILTPKPGQHVVWTDGPLGTLDGYVMGEPTLRIFDKEYGRLPGGIVRVYAPATSTTYVVSARRLTLL